jgi:hypothetical protein
MSRRHTRRIRALNKAACSEALERRLFLSASLAFNGSQTLTPGATTNVSGDAVNAQSEMSLVVNPTNPLNLVGFSHRVSTPIVLDVYSSSDGGSTWTTNQITNANDGFGAAGNRFDPAVTFDANGVCYIVYGHREPGTPNRTRLVGARSTDGGVVFGNFRTIDIQTDRGTSPAVDKWYINSGPDPATGNQAVYVGYVHFALEGATANTNDDRIMVAGTRDGGNTWTAPIVINDPSIAGAETGPTYACPVVGRNGELAVSWHDTGDSTVMFDRDMDGLWATGFNFGTDITVRTGINVVRNSVIPPAQPQRGVNAGPMLDVWRNTNWLLMPVVQQFNGNDLDIWVGISTNFGDSWNFQRVEGALSTDFNPWLAVDQRTGVFHVLYYSTDGDASGNDDVRPKIASSFDAGATWQRGFLSTQTSNEAGGYTGDYLEYIGLAARDGTVQGLWSSRYAGGGTDLDALTANAAFVSSTGDNRLIIGESGSPDDNFLVRLSPSNPAYLEVFVDGVREFTGLRQSVNKIIFNPGGGTNNFNIGTIPGISSLTINGTNNADTINIDFLGANMPPLTMVLADDTDGDDVVTLGTGPTDFLTINSPVNIFGDAGSDRLNVGSGFAQAIAGNVSFDGGPDGFNTIYLYDTQYTAETEYDLNGNSIVYHGFAPPYTVSYANVSQIELHGGSGSDIFTVHSNVVVPIVRAYGNGANDLFSLGDGPAPTGVRTFDGGAGTLDTMNIDAHNDPTGRVYQVTPTSVDPPGWTANTPSVEKVSVLAGTSGDTFNFAVQTFSQDITIDAGLGNDAINTNGAILPTATLLGGGGTFDNLSIDDRGFPAGGQAFASVYVDRIVRIYAPAPQMSLNYDGIEGVVYYLPQKQNEVQVFGVSSNIPGSNSFQILGNALADTFLVYPTLATPNINGPLYLTGAGGADQVALVDDGVAPGTYTLSNPTGGGAAFLFGLGAGYVGVQNDVENLNIYGGSGNDNFVVEQFQSGTALALLGRGGNDSCTIGNGDMSANLTNAAGFTFDGGSNTDRFTIANGLTNTPWNYQTQDDFIEASRPSTGYLWHSATLNIESQYFFAGSAGDAFYIDAVAPGLYTECNGDAGIDGLVFGFSTSNLENVRGPIAYNGGTDGGNMAVTDTADTTGDIVHLTASALGAYPGDTLFGPGGSLTFSDLVNFGSFPGITLNLGSGADTVYAQPLATARVTINGNNPTTSPGDKLNLALAGVQNPVVSHGSSGNVTSSNRQTMNWTGFEQSVQPIDDVAPAVTNFNFKLGNGGGRTIAPQSLRVTFSEAIGSAVTADFLSLFNVTTNTHVPVSNIAVAYDPATLTATFTFPGYPGGVLPNGTYQAQVLAGLGDSFGNSMPASAVHTFIWAAGTAGNDAFRVARAANLSDVVVFLNNETTPAFVAGPSVAKVVLAGDSGNDSLVLDMTNLDPTPTTGGIDFDASDGDDSIKVKGSVNADGVSFFADYISPGANVLTHRNVETKLYDGGGGYDGLFVYGTTVILPVSQRFGALRLTQGATVIAQPSVNGVLVARDFNLTDTSRLDLNDSDLIVDYTGASRLANVQGWINAARNGGAWNGAGITSSAAAAANPANRTLGAMEATDFKSIYGSGATFDGETIDNTAVLVKFTWYGDGDFNGKVNFDDYVRTDAGFNNHRTGWVNGDFDGNGQVNFDDYVLIDLAFNTQSGTLRR